MSDELYYILDARSMVGDCCLWWCPDGKGYTCDLGQAGLYTKEQTTSMRDTDVLVPQEVVEGLVVRHVQLDKLREHVKIPPVHKPGRRR